MSSLVTPGLPVTHDGQDHVARIANFYQSLSEGNIVPRWASNLNWGFGHPVIMFLYPFPSYLASVFHAFRFSFIDSYKLVFALTYVVSIVIMFLWISRMVGILEAFVASLMYGFAPYRFVDMYVRGAIGEHTAFMFAPLLFWGLWEAASEKKQDRYGRFMIIAGLWGLMLSHNAAIIMMAPLTGIYFLYLYAFESRDKKQFLVTSLSSLVLGMCLSAFFWIPAFFEGKYTLRDIVTQGEAATRTISLLSVIYSPWNYLGGADFTKQLGIIGWVELLTLISFANTIKVRKTKIFVIGLFLSLGVSIFIMTDQSRFIWERISIIEKFQFPWRFLWLTTFIVGVLGAYATACVQKKYRSVLVIFITFGILISTLGMWRPKSYTKLSDAFFTGKYHGTTDTGESSPIWSVRFMEQEATESMGVIEGVAQSELRSTSTTKYEYIVDAASDARFVKNTLYFPGWNIFVDGNIVPIEFQDPQYRGLMTYRVNQGKHTVHIIFGDTKLRTVSNIISLISLLVIVPLIYIARRKR